MKMPKSPKPRMPKASNAPKSRMPKASNTPKSRTKVVKGYAKKNGTFVNPHIKGLPKF